MTKARFPPLAPSDDWLRQRQALALPVLPPTTKSARKYFFDQLNKFSRLAVTSGRKKIDFEAFSCEWNGTADGKERFYITPEVLATYAKSWERVSNIWASQDLISQQMGAAALSASVFAAENQPFPPGLVAGATQMDPSQGVLDLQDNRVPDALQLPDIPMGSLIHLPELPPAELISAPTTALGAESNSQPLLSSTQVHNATTPTAGPSLPTEPMAGMGSSSSILEGRGTGRKRRRVVPEDTRKRGVRKCRRCEKAECPGGSNIAWCPLPCTTPCRHCHRFDCLQGIDRGRKCSFKEAR